MKSRAAILRDVGGPWRIETFDLDAPRTGEVLIRMAAAGLCHSDTHILNGHVSDPGRPARKRPPTIGGHEGSAVVVEAGPGVTGFAPGDHVVTSFVPACGRCRWCASGMEYLCDLGAGTMTPGMPTDGTFRHHTSDGLDLGHVAKIGAFAEHTVVAADSLVKIDPALPLVPAALLACAIPTGYGSAVHRAGVRGGDTVVVVGAGGIGTAAIQGARIAGAAIVVAVDPVEFKRASALRFGATHVADSASEAVDLVRDLTRGVMADGVVLAPSLVTATDIGAGLALTRKGGNCVVTGLAAPDTRTMSCDVQEFTLMNKSLHGTVFGSCNQNSDIAALTRLYFSGQLMLDEMITRRYRLDEVNDAYRHLLAGKLIRGVIEF
ncbi:oxidoreductase, Rxyl_3153 family [Mycolicibacterium chubuense NBB4]|uniref:alcohol dehydrogenase n=1 Tax=Mycolicibacterium chubuense (strain NBB4) TaxID=710421 RepID=I4BJ03_MYCCN|nr:NDMA-dependent alcohol dehydrogenase [Mycolicibacterium chubuense]AFM17260.1 oxidoreductase, Rxyl_3153 family [Mycolicibacterium chubuense NBB4]